MSKEDHYIALGAAAILVAMLHREKTLFARASITLLSAGAGHTMGPEMATSFQLVGESTAVIAVTALVFVAFEAISGLIADRAALLKILRARFGGKDKGES